MDTEVIKQSINSITEKLGKEQVAQIADDIGIIQVAINEGTDALKARDERIKELEQSNERYVAANANLLKKIPINEENKLVPRSESQSTPERPYVDPFDEWGRLKK